MLHNDLNSVLRTYHQSAFHYQNKAFQIHLVLYQSDFAVNPETEQIHLWPWKTFVWCVTYK